MPKKKRTAPKEVKAPVVEPEVTEDVTSEDLAEALEVETPETKEPTDIALCNLIHNGRRYNKGEKVKPTDPYYYFLKENGFIN